MLVVDGLSCGTDKLPTLYFCQLFLTNNTSETWRGAQGMS